MYKQKIIERNCTFILQKVFLMFEKITPEQVGLSSKVVLNTLSKIEKQGYNFHSFMLLKDGKALTEAYWAPFKKDQPHLFTTLIIPYFHLFLIFFAKRESPERDFLYSLTTVQTNSGFYSAKLFNISIFFCCKERRKVIYYLYNFFYKRKYIQWRLQNVPKQWKE